MKLIDARKKPCPQPVIMAKKAADEGEEQITVIVDNEIAKQNIMKFADKLKFSVACSDKEDGIYILLKRNGNSNNVIATEMQPEKQAAGKIGYVISTDKLGKGSDKLGAILMKSFMYAISEKNPYPEFIIFLNAGVKLTTDGSECLDDLIKLQQSNVEIVSCGTCLDFFEIKSKLRVGTVSNMYDIIDMISSSANTVTI